MKKIALLISVAGVALAAGDAAAGKAAYDKACKSCHGADGAPNAAIAKMMKVEMKHLADAQGHNDEEMKKIVVDGVGKMKATKGLAGKDADNIVAFVRTLKK